MLHEVQITIKIHGKAQKLFLIIHGMNNTQKNWKGNSKLKRVIKKLKQTRPPWMNNWMNQVQKAKKEKKLNAKELWHRIKRGGEPSQNKRPFFYMNNVKPEKRMRFVSPLT